MRLQRCKTFAQLQDAKWYSSNFAQVTTGREMPSMTLVQHFRKLSWGINKTYTTTRRTETTTNGII